MASSAQKLRYGAYTDGSLARDLEWDLRRRELDHAGEAPRHQEVVKPRVQEKPRTRQAQRVSPVTVIGAMAVIALSLVLLMNYISLLEISTETVELKKELTALETDHVTLTAQYEQMFDRSSVKEAAEAAGMAKPSGSQVFYIDLSDGDSAVVYHKEEPSVFDNLLSSLHHGVYAVVEYFD